MIYAMPWDRHNGKNATMQCSSRNFWCECAQVGSQWYFVSTMMHFSCRECFGALEYRHFMIRPFYWITSTFNAFCMNWCSQITWHESTSLAGYYNFRQTDSNNNSNNGYKSIINNNSISSKQQSRHHTTMGNNCKNISFNGNNGIKTIVAVCCYPKKNGKKSVGHEHEQP